MKRILVPTDFSEQAGFAMDLACQIARKTKSELVALHVLDHTGLFDFSAGSSAYPLMGNPAGLDLDQEFMETLYSNAEERCTAFLGNYESSGLKITKKIKIGSAFHYITEEINEEKTNLVIMGSKGSSGFEEVLIGSNTEKVVRHAKCPVLTVKSKMNLENVKDIVFATSFKDEDSHVAGELKKLQEVFNAKLHLVRVNTPNCFETNRKIMAQADLFVKENNITNYTINIYSDKVEEDGIIFFAQDINADLIALATHGRSGLLHLLSGSIAEDVVNHAIRPVWTFRLKH
ncbi:MAG: universal stress protein [Cytophagales bacterium]|nr:universal stress protein [Cytophagales bacterium]